MENSWNDLFASQKPIKNTSKTYKTIVELTNWLPENATIRQRLWHLINNTKTIPICKMCENVVKWDDTKPNIQQKYRTYCSTTCQQKDPENRRKKHQTETEKYGKGRPEVVKKIKQTNKQRYGADFAIQTQQIKQKQKQTVLKRYNVENVIQHPEIFKKREQTMYNVYGIKSIARAHIPVEICRILDDKQKLEQLHINEQKSIVEIANTLGVNYEVVTRSLSYHNIPHKKYPISFGEKQIADFLTQLEIEFITNDKTLIPPYQLDFVIPEHKIAIEYNGIFWHSESRGRTKNYHITKTNMCKEKGYQLIHIFENEWVNSTEIVKSMLANKLGKTKNKIYARDCELRFVEQQLCKKFLEKNHIQGFVFSKVNLGLFYKDQLVCLMTFSKPRYSKHQYEMYRFCNTTGLSVVGGASRLFNFFVKTHNPTNIISYSDKRWSLGGLYQKLGFKYSHTSSPNYWYFLPGTLQLLSRVNFQKHKLKKNLEVYDEKLSEPANMFNNGYDRIWDCGNDVWVWER